MRIYEPIYSLQFMDDTLFRKKKTKEEDRPDLPRYVPARDGV